MRASKEELLKELELSESILFSDPSFNSALVGITIDGRAVYDYDKMVEFLCKEDSVSLEDAEEFIHYNTIRALPYTTGAPIIINLYCT